VHKAKIELNLSPEEKKEKLARIMTVRNKEGLNVLKSEIEALKLEKESIG
jgi:hypothetical protein